MMAHLEEKRELLDSSTLKRRKRPSRFLLEETYPTAYWLRICSKAALTSFLRSRSGEYRRRLPPVSLTHWLRATAPRNSLEVRPRPTPTRVALESRNSFKARSCSPRFPFPSEMRRITRRRSELLSRHIDRVIDVRRSRKLLACLFQGIS
jgi:hypothetical protein